MTTKASSTRKPPAGAVAQDAHWAKTMARLEKLKPATTVFTICDDLDVKQRHAEARAEARAAKAVLDATDESDTEAHSFARNQWVRAAAEAEEAQAAYDKIAVRLTFQALGRQELETLQGEHPPTEKQEADGAAWNHDTFAPALIAAASTDGMPIDYARQCLDTWSAGDANALYQAALSVQQQPRTDLGKG